MDGTQENDKGFPAPGGAGREVSVQAQTPVQGAGQFPPAGGQAGGGPPATRRPIPPKFYRIGEVATYAGTSRQTIHNYTTMGLIQESQWSQGGHRLYDETVFPRLDEILLMKAHRRTLKDIRESLEGRPDRRT